MNVTTYKFPSKSSAGKKHTVTQTPAGKIYCSCRGWRYYQNCWHIRAVLSGQIPPGAYRVVRGAEVRPAPKLTINLPIRRSLASFPRFQWIPSRVKGRWVLGGGPEARYPAGGVIAQADHLALMLGDAAHLSRSGLQWFDPQRRTAPWRNTWPEWLWPETRKPCSKLILVMALKHGITPRLASNRLPKRRQ